MQGFIEDFPIPPCLFGLYLYICIHHTDEKLDQIHHLIFIMYIGKYETNFTLFQYCPFPYDLVKKELDKYPDAQIAWAQEEHKFQGAWAFVTYRLNHLLKKQKEIL